MQLLPDENLSRRLDLSLTAYFLQVSKWLLANGYGSGQLGYL